MNIIHFLIVVGIIFLFGYFLNKFIWKILDKIYQRIEAKRERKERRNLYGRN